MRKLLISIIVIASMVLFLVSCSESTEDQFDYLSDYTLNKGIIGNWSNTNVLDGNEMSQSLWYQFDESGNFVVSRIIIDNNTTETVGYRYLAKGIYQIKKDILILSIIEQYIHDDTSGLYSSLDDLEYSNVQNTDSKTIALNSAQDVLTFIYPPCGPLENCIVSQEFQRVD